MKIRKCWTIVSSWYRTVRQYPYITLLPGTESRTLSLVSKRLACRPMSLDPTVYKSGFNRSAILHDHFLLSSVGSFFRPDKVELYWSLILIRTLESPPNTVHWWAHDNYWYIGCGNCWISIGVTKFIWS